MVIPNIHTFTSKTFKKTNIKFTQTSCERRVYAIYANFHPNSHVNASIRRLSAIAHFQTRCRIPEMRRRARARARDSNSFIIYFFELSLHYAQRSRNAYFQTRASVSSHYAAVSRRWIHRAYTFALTLQSCVPYMQRRRNAHPPLRIPKYTRHTKPPPSVYTVYMDAHPPPPITHTRTHHIISWEHSSCLSLMVINYIPRYYIYACLAKRRHLSIGRIPHPTSRRGCGYATVYEFFGVSIYIYIVYVVVVDPKCSAHWRIVSAYKERVAAERRNATLIRIHIISQSQAWVMRRLCGALCICRYMHNRMQLNKWGSANGFRAHAFESINARSAKSRSDREEHILRLRCVLAYQKME